MEDFNEYMKEYKTYSLEDKRKVALDQLKILASLTNKMCEELGVENDLNVTKDIVEAQKENASEEDILEGIVVYTSLIQTALCTFVDKFTDILEKKE